MKAVSPFLALCAALVGLFALPGYSPAAEAGSVRIAQLTIKPGQIQAFTDAVRVEMRESLRLEPGVIAIYAVADKQDPARFTFFEIYVSEEAYQAHRETAHFRRYFESTKDMIADRVLLEAVPVEMRDKHNTPES